MNFKGLGIILLATAFLILMAAANQQADDFAIGKITVTGEGQIIPNYGYYVYREFLNYDLNILPTEWRSVPRRFSILSPNPNLSVDVATHVYALNVCHIIDLHLIKKSV